jgi:hypothetical protein
MESPPFIVCLGLIKVHILSSLLYESPPEISGLDSG